MRHRSGVRVQRVAEVRSRNGGRGPLAARGPYGLNVVQGGDFFGGGTGGGGGGGDWWGGGGGWGLVGGGGRPLRTALHTISISFQNSFC